MRQTASERMADLMVRAERLREKVRDAYPGGCRIVSVKDCTCPLCDVDALATAAREGIWRQNSQERQRG